MCVILNKTNKLFDLSTFRVFTFILCFCFIVILRWFSPASFWTMCKLNYSTTKTKRTQPPTHWATMICVLLCQCVFVLLELSVTKQVPAKSYMIRESNYRGKRNITVVRRYKCLFSHTHTHTPGIYLYSLVKTCSSNHRAIVWLQFSSVKYNHCNMLSIQCKNTTKGKKWQQYQKHIVHE